MRRASPCPLSVLTNGGLREVFEEPGVGRSEAGSERLILYSPSHGEIRSGLDKGPGIHERLAKVFVEQVLERQPGEVLT